MTLPPERVAHSMVYESARGLMLVFGGAYAPPASAGRSDRDLNDTWAYDPVANTWTELKPSADSPGARYLASMVYERSVERVVLFGGFRGGADVLGDMWEYDPASNTWTEVTPIGETPGARACSSLVCLPSTGGVFMFGGSADRADLNDTWVYTR